MAKQEDLLNEWFEAETLRRQSEARSNELKAQLGIFQFNGNGANAGNRKLSAAARDIVHEAEGTAGWAKLPKVQSEPKAQHDTPVVSFEAATGALRRMWDEERAKAGKKIGITPEYLRTAAVELAGRYGVSSVARAVNGSAANIAKWLKEFQALKAHEPLVDDVSTEALRLEFAAYRQEMEKVGRKRFDWPPQLLKRAVALIGDKPLSRIAKELDIKRESLKRAVKLFSTNKPDPTASPFKKSPETIARLKASWTPERRQRYSDEMKARLPKLQRAKRKAERAAKKAEAEKEPA